MGKLKHYCSFCGKCWQESLRLIDGPGGVHICNECVDLLYNFIHSQPLISLKDGEGEMTIRRDDNMTIDDVWVIYRYLLSLQKAGINVPFEVLSAIERLCKFVDKMVPEK